MSKFKDGIKKEFDAIAEIDEKNLTLHEIKSDEIKVKKVSA